MSNSNRECNAVALTDDQLDIVSGGGDSFNNAPWCGSPIHIGGGVGETPDPDARCGKYPIVLGHH